MILLLKCDSLYFQYYSLYYIVHKNLLLKYNHFERLVNLQFEEIRAVIRGTVPLIIFILHNFCITPNDTPVSLES